MFRRWTTGRGPTALGPASVLIGLVAATVISAPSALAGAPDAAAAPTPAGWRRRSAESGQ